MSKSTPKHKRLTDWLTLISISIVAYLIAQLLHEGVGHGVVCLLFGGTPETLSSAYFEFVTDSVSEVGRTWIAGGGTLVNLLAGIFFGWLLMRSTSEDITTNLFFWLGMTVNLLIGTGYFLFSGIIGMGDLITVGRMLPHTPWRIFITLFGLVLYAGTISWALRLFRTKFGLTFSIHWMVIFTVYTYVFGSLAVVFTTVMNPQSIYILTTAAAVFGGTSALAWMAQLLKTNRFGTPHRGKHTSTTPIERNWKWIGLALILWLGTAILLGPGIQF